MLNDLLKKMPISLILNINYRIVFSKDAIFAVSKKFPMVSRKRFSRDGKKIGQAHFRIGCRFYEKRIPTKELQKAIKQNERKKTKKSNTNGKFSF